jgi:hypothetical protein
MPISEGYLALAQILEESMSSLSHNDVRSRLSAAVAAAHQGTGKSAQFVDHNGDGTSGEAMYTVDGETHAAPYTTDKSSATVDIKKAKKVQPIVKYRPIDAPKESAAAPREGSLQLVESGAVLEQIPLCEAFKGAYPIKLIAPGKGSSAFYPAEVLKRDGPKVFPAGTHVYINHPTAAEEAARPEGDVRNLAGVLGKDAYWLDSHKEGPGLYSEVKPFADHVQSFDEKGPYCGMSIRASGIAESGKSHGGLPVLKELIAADSVDMVTRAGAGGMILQEAAGRTTDTAKPAAEILNQGGADDMDAALVQRLQVAEAQVRKLTERASVAEAAGVIADYFKTVRVGEAIEQRVARRVLAGPLPTLAASGELDRAAITSLAEAETKDEVTYIAQLTGRPVTGMGVIQEAALTEAQRAEQAKDQERELANSAAAFGVRGKMGLKIWSEGRSAFDPNYNAGDKEAAA